MPPTLKEKYNNLLSVSHDTMKVNDLLLLISLKVAIFSSDSNTLPPRYFDVYVFHDSWLFIIFSTHILFVIPNFITTVTFPIPNFLKMLTYL